MPANELFSAVAIDGWLQDEKHATIRFAYSTEIENRSLVLNDLTSSQLIRYIRLSFTTRDSRRSSTTFMLGHFYGTRFFSPWHLYSTTGAFNANAQVGTRKIEQEITSKLCLDRRPIERSVLGRFEICVGSATNELQRIRYLNYKVVCSISIKC